MLSGYVIKRTFALLGKASLLLAVLALWAPATQAQQRSGDLPRPSPNALVSQTIGVTRVTISYGRPQVRDRQIFGKLVPYGEVWRAGANEATTISFSNDVRVQGVPLEAGTYAFFTLPSRAFWRLIFNREENQWGAFDYDPSEDALRVPARPRQAEHQEMLTFSFEDVTNTSTTVVLRWDSLKVPFRVSVNTDAAVRRQALQVVPTTDDWQTPYRYARYAFQRSVYLPEAIGWAGRSVRLGENYDNLALLARLYAQTGNYTEAIDVGDHALRTGRTMEETPNDLQELEQDMAEWRSKQ